MASVTKLEANLPSMRYLVLPSSLYIDVTINPGFSGYNFENGGNDSVNLLHSTSIPYILCREGSVN